MEGSEGGNAYFPHTLFFLPPHSCHGNGNIHATLLRALESRHSCVNSNRWTLNRRKKKLVLRSFLLPVCGQAEFQVILI